MYFHSDILWHVFVIFIHYLQIDLKHEGDSNTLRENGRKFNENR